VRRRESNGQKKVVHHHIAHRVDAAIGGHGVDLLCQDAALENQPGEISLGQLFLRNRARGYLSTGAAVISVGAVLTFCDGADGHNVL